MRLRAILLGFFGASLLTLSGLLLLGSWGAYRTAQGTSPEPQIIPLRDLSATGYGDNRHVKVTGCALGHRYVAAQRNWAWEHVSVPLVPVDDDPGDAVPAVKNFWVVLVSSRPRRESDLKSLLQQSSVQGVVWRDRSMIELSEQNELRRLYPGLDWSKCLVLQEGVVPMKESTALAFLASSAGMVVLTGLIFWIWLIFCFAPWLEGYQARDRLLTAAARAERRRRAGRPPAAPQSKHQIDPQARWQEEAVRPPPEDHAVEE
jgi:hypothetical protein